MSDHPRVGGEHVPATTAFWSRPGSSPRGRGTLWHPTTTNWIWRIIPAWAGNTPNSRAQVRSQSDHPRVGGEHCGIQLQRIGYGGSSPRGRGTRQTRVRRCAPSRIIPAWAGNTSRWPRSACAPTDHPRVGGEHVQAAYGARSFAGSSPRGRGTHVGMNVAAHRRRIIPAWAGNTVGSVPAISPSPDHPRVGGEHAQAFGSSIAQSGSSPRGRGTPTRRRSLSRFRRIIPAWAGNTKFLSVVECATPDHPRVGGEHRTALSALKRRAGSSPRGRGTQSRKMKVCLACRIIPAWAGNTALSLPWSPRSTDHPRVGGEHRLI